MAGTCDGRTDHLARAVAAFSQTAHYCWTGALKSLPHYFAGDPSSWAKCPLDSSRAKFGGGKELELRDATNIFNWLTAPKDNRWKGPLRFASIARLKDRPSNGASRISGEDSVNAFPGVSCTEVQFSGKVAISSGEFNPAIRSSMVTQEDHVEAKVAGPVSKEELGRATWTLLHTLAAQYPDKPTRQQQKDVRELMGIFSRLYPCKQCADHFKEVLKSNPVEAGSGVELAQWMCRVHNIVNRSLGKPHFPCQRVDARWGALECDEGACDLQGRVYYKRS